MSTTVVRGADPAARAARSIALRVGATTALVVLVGIIGAALIFDNQQLAEIHDRVATVAVSADDVIDAPPGTWIVALQAGARQVTPGMPEDVLAAAVSAIGRRGSVGLTTEGHTWPAWVAHRGARTVIAVYDIRLHNREEERLITSAAIAGGAGVALAALTGLFAGRRAVRPLAEALELQREFVADASHELRTPLAVISMRAQLLSRRLADDPDAVRRREADQLVADTQAMADVVSDLLLSAQLEYAERGSARVDLRDVAAAVVASLAPYAAGSGVDLRLAALPAGDAEDRAERGSVPEEPPVVEGVTSSLRRAILALVDNAIAHAPRDSDVVVAVAREDGEVWVEVVDHGPGVGGADLERLTRRFARARNDGSTRRVGLGLALVTQIVRSHGGRLEVSDTPGGGATFSLVIPARSLG